MATLSRTFVSVVVALLLAFVPRAAHAAHHEAYPIKADDFREEIEKKIARTKSAIEKKLERNGVSAARRTEVRHIVDEVSRPLKNALDKATSDNNVTKEEARDVRALAKALRGKVRARLRVDRDSRRSGRASTHDDSTAASHKKPTSRSATESRASDDEH